MKNDPILSPIAQKQVQETVKNTAKGGFMAKPAPNSTYKENAGPRMTKTTALRLGFEMGGCEAQEGGNREIRGREGDARV